MDGNSPETGPFQNTIETPTEESSSDHLIKVLGKYIDPLDEVFSHAAEYYTQSIDRFGKALDSGDAYLKFLGIEVLKEEESIESLQRDYPNKYNRYQETCAQHPEYQEKITTLLSNLEVVLSEHESKIIESIVREAGDIQQRIDYQKIFQRFRDDVNERGDSSVDLYTLMFSAFDAFNNALPNLNQQSNDVVTRVQDIYRLHSNKEYIESVYQEYLLESANGIAIDTAQRESHIETIQLFMSMQKVALYGNAEQEKFNFDASPVKTTMFGRRMYSILNYFAESDFVQIADNPMMLQELAKSLEPEITFLDPSANQNPKRYIREVTERFREIEAKLATEPGIEISQEEQAIWEVAKRYQSIISEDLMLRETSGDLALRDTAFVQAVQEIMSSEHFSQVEARILQSELVSLHYMLIGGGLEEAINTYAEKNKLNLADLSTKEREDLEITLLEAFIHSNSDKAKEQEFSERFSYAPTFGMELERPELMSSIIIEKIILESVAKQLMEGPSDDNKLNTKEKSISQGKLDHFLKDKGISKEFVMSQLLDPKTDEEREVRQGFIEFCNQRVSEFTEVLGKNQSADADLQDYLRYRNIPTRGQRLEKLGAFKDILGGNYLREVVSSPSISPRMQLREMLLLKKSGILGEAASVHITIGGVEIRPGRTDFFQVRALIEGAKFLEEIDSEKNLGDLVALFSRNISTSEYFLKGFEYGGEQYVVPFFKLRKLWRSESSADIKRYHNSEQAYAVESRSFPALDQTKFADVVRVASFEWLAAWGEAAAAIPETERDEAQVKLAASWTSLMKNWSQLKELYGIANLPEEQLCSKIDKKFIEGNDLEKIKDHMRQITKPAFLHLNHISVVGGINGHFRAECRRLIREYSRDIKKIIGY